MRAQDNTEGVARLIVVRLFLWLAPTFLWKYEVNVGHADLDGAPQRHNHSRPSCNQDDACLDRNSIWSPARFPPCVRCEISSRVCARL